MTFLLNITLNQNNNICFYEKLFSVFCVNEQHLANTFEKFVNRF